MGPPVWAKRISALYFALVSCDAGISDTSASCQTYCSKLETCDDRTNLLGCEQKCSEQRVRSDLYLTTRAECAEKLSCNIFGGEVDQMGLEKCASGAQCKLNHCTSNELALEADTPSQMSYCQEAVTKIYACDHTLDTEALQISCLDLVPTLSPAYLQDQRQCIEKDCNQLVSCLQRSADHFDAELSIYPSALTRK